MKKILLLFSVSLLLMQSCQAWSWDRPTPDEKAIRRLLNSQVRYANNGNFDKFIKTYSPKYVNSDGFNLDVYSSLVKEIWESYGNIKYSISLNNINIDNNKATVGVTEYSNADISLSKAYDGELKSKAESVYYLEKINGTWKVVSDSVLDEHTTMLYGMAKDLDVKLTVPTTIEANTDYVATLEFEPPKKTIAIASLASDIVEYPQKPTKEVFRPLPEDNILERYFTSNNQNANEYIVASIGITETEVQDLNIRLNLTGFGYAIRRVNVIHPAKGGEDVKAK